jgi:hypothetical protein
VDDLASGAGDARQLARVGTDVGMELCKYDKHCSEKMLFGLKGCVFSMGHDAGVIPQALEKLRTVQLVIDGLKLDPLGEFLALRTV